MTLAASTVMMTSRAISPRPRSRVARFGWNAAMYAASIDMVRTANAAAAPTWRQSVVGLRRPSRSSFSMSAAVTTWPVAQDRLVLLDRDLDRRHGVLGLLAEPGRGVAVRHDVAGDEAAGEIDRQRALVLGKLVADSERQLAHHLGHAPLRQLVLERRPEQPLGLAGDQVPAGIVQAGQRGDRRLFERRLAQPGELALALVRREPGRRPGRRDPLEQRRQAGPLLLDGGRVDLDDFLDGARTPSRVSALVRTWLV